MGQIRATGELFLELFEFTENIVPKKNLVDSRLLRKYKPVSECDNCHTMVAFPKITNRLHYLYCEIEPECSVRGKHAHKICDRCGNRWTEGVY